MRLWEQGVPCEKEAMESLWRRICGRFLKKEAGDPCIKMPIAYVNKSTGKLM
jgi:hypothetical protein